MKKKEPKKILNEFSWIYMFFAVVGFIFAVLVLLIPAIPEAFEKTLSDGTDVVIYLETSLIVSSLIDLWYFYLLRRYTSGKSNGTLIMVLLTIGVVLNAISMIVTKGQATLNFIIDAVVLYFLYSSKKKSN